MHGRCLLRVRCVLPTPSRQTKLRYSYISRPPRIVAELGWYGPTNLFLPLNLVWFCNKICKAAIWPNVMLLSLSRSFRWILSAVTSQMSSFGHHSFFSLFDWRNFFTQDEDRVTESQDSAIPKTFFLFLKVFPPSSLLAFSFYYARVPLDVNTVSTSAGIDWCTNKTRYIWFQEDSYSDEDSGTEEVSDAEDWCKQTLPLPPP